MRKMLRTESVGEGVLLRLSTDWYGVQIAHIIINPTAEIVSRLYIKHTFSFPILPLLG